MNTHGGKRRIHAPRKLSHDQAREISLLISQGVQGKVIADRFGVGRRTIYTALARLETECTRSHPHENMDGYCALRTEIARLTNKNAQLERELAKASKPTMLSDILKDIA